MNLKNEIFNVCSNDPQKLTDIIKKINSFTNKKPKLFKRRLQKEGFFKIIKMKSIYEKPSEKKKRIRLENIKRAKKFQRLRNRL